MRMCCSRRFGGVDFADRFTPGLSHKWSSSAMRIADPGRLSSWLAMVLQNFAWTQKTDAICLSLGGKFQNQELETVPESAGVPRLINRTIWLAAFFAFEFKRNATKRITPARLSSAARRHTMAPMLARFKSCSEGEFHSARTTGSTKTIPTIFSGYRAANNGMVSPPKEWPTRT